MLGETRSSAGPCCVRRHGSPQESFPFHLLPPSFFFFFFFLSVVAPKSQKCLSSTVSLLTAPLSSLNIQTAVEILAQVTIMRHSEDNGRQESL